MSCDVSSVSYQTDRYKRCPASDQVSHKLTLLRSVTWLMQLSFIKSALSTPEAICRWTAISGTFGWSDHHFPSFYYSMESCCLLGQQRMSESLLCKSYLPGLKSQVTNFAVQTDSGQIFTAAAEVGPVVIASDVTGRFHSYPRPAYSACLSSLCPLVSSHPRSWCLCRSISRSFRNKFHNKTMATSLKLFCTILFKVKLHIGILSFPCLLSSPLFSPSAIILTEKAGQIIKISGGRQAATPHYAEGNYEDGGKKDRKKERKVKHQICHFRTFM